MSFKSFDQQCLIKSSHVKKSIGILNKQKKYLLFVKDFFSFETNSYFPMECDAKWGNDLKKMRTENVEKFALEAFRNSNKLGEASFNLPLANVISEEHNFNVVVRTSHNFMEKYFAETYIRGGKAIGKKTVKKKKPTKLQGAVPNLQRSA